MIRKVNKILKVYINFKKDKKLYVKENIIN